MVEINLARERPALGNKTLPPHTKSQHSPQLLEEAASFLDLPGLTVQRGRISGFGSGVSGFGFRVSGSGFRISGFGFRFRVSGSGF